MRCVKVATAGEAYSAVSSHIKNTEEVPDPLLLSGYCIAWIINTDALFRLVSDCSNFELKCYQPETLDRVKLTFRHKLLTEIA